MLIQQERLGGSPQLQSWLPSLEWTTVAAHSPPARAPRVRALTDQIVMARGTTETVQTVGSMLPQRA
jgi:hypothetical protein